MIVDFMTKKLKTNSSILYDAKHRISFSPSFTICSDLNLIVYYDFCRGRKKDIKAQKLPTL